MESTIKEALKTKIFKPIGTSSGGCINEGEIFLTDDGPVFIKRNNSAEVSIKTF